MRAECKYCGGLHPTLAIEENRKVTWWHEGCYQIWQQVIEEDERVGAEIAEREMKDGG